MNPNSMRPEEYSGLVSKMTPKSRHLRGCLRAFWVGGAICVLGQLLTQLAAKIELGEVTAPMFTSAALIFLGTTLTGLGVYDRIGKYAGAGSIVPITGFANSVASPALEFKAEGMITGLAAKMFTVAGPIIVYGVLSGTAVGIIYYLLGL